MSLKDEISVFNKAKLSAATGETEVWDRVIYPNVIRKREIDIILSRIEQVKPRRLLDFGCGVGWLSKFLSSKGYHCVGVDASSSLIKSAITSSSNNSQFVIGDCMSLPFQDGSFDFVVGIGILHHLDPKQGLAECYRVLSRKGTLLLMEPNKFSPVGALGRRIAPLDTHTPGEQPLSSTELKHILLRTGWIVEHTGYMFPYSAALSQILRITRLDRLVWGHVCAPIKATEQVLERIPLLKQLCWVILVEVRKT